ncbi:hypothetical protein GCM10022198_25000 [Klugiella xanthotipulae]|uniref:Peptidoglycan binding protein n=1 Tax=Klugiella xanthotipulae TaxID=244735 RepID=A0A543HZ37_9MICO|nr:hypothetical protein [Klugiella xanthotipulae]TQM63607.1 hypothetical protein FB466_1877 [Klugiella xanthotipulae]
MSDVPRKRFSRTPRPTPEEATTEVLTTTDAVTELLSTTDEGTEESTESTRPAKRTRAAGAGLSGHRLIWTIAAVATVCLVAGVVLSRFIISPGQAAADAKPPIPGLITVPVESRVIANSVTTRGDVTYADSVEVTLETGELGGSPVVTGQVPEPGAILEAGSVALEVVGRPVIVLPGELPVYRSLSVGLSGPDVLQLKQALNALGIGAGNLESDVFDASTAAGVKALYQRVGYAPPSSDASAEGGDPVTSAEEGLASARDALAQANAALTSAQKGPTGSERIEQDNLVRSAQRDLHEARSSGNSRAVSDAQDALTLAEARREEIYAPKDTRAEQSAVTSAQSQVAGAEQALSSARNGALTSLPASEVLYLNNLPRRVDNVAVKRGGLLSGAAMSVSGATMQISANVSEADAQLISAGMKAEFAAPGGDTISAEVLSVGKKQATKDENGETTTSGATRYEVQLNPGSLTDEQRSALTDSNVKITIPVSSTKGDVLAVPLAALTAGAGGESRVEIVTDAQKEETELVAVTTGLAAEGFVEITAEGRSSLLTEGAQVVVGR